MKTYLMTDELFIERPIQKVFDFFAQAENLNKVTPPELNFKILTPLPIDMGKGTLIDYKIRIKGIPVRWRTEITVWDPPHRFRDVQLKGPYRKWEHTHEFEARNGGTLMRDRVHYQVPGWILAPVIHRLFVRPDVERIFAYRHRAFSEILSSID